MFPDLVLELRMIASKSFIREQTRYKNLLATNR